MIHGFSKVGFRVLEEYMHLSCKAGKNEEKPCSTGLNLGLSTDRPLTGPSLIDNGAKRSEN